MNANVNVATDPSTNEDLSRRWQRHHVPVIAWIELDPLLQKYWHTAIYLLLYSTNSALMFYFILFTFSITFFF